MSEDESKKSSIGGEISSLGGIELGFAVHKKVLKWSGYLALEILVVLMISLLFLKPQIAKLNKIRKETAGQVEKMKRMEDKVNTLDDFALEFGQYQSLITRIIPQDNNLGVILSGIRKASNDSGVELVSYSVENFKNTKDDSLSGKGLAKSGLEVHVSGSGGQVQSFLDKLNNSIPLKNVEEFGVSRQNIGEQTSNNLRVRLRVSTYHLTKDFEKTSVNQALRPIDQKDRELLSELEAYDVWQVDTQPVTQPGENDNLFGL